MQTLKGRRTYSLSIIPTEIGLHVNQVFNENLCKFLYTSDKGVLSNK